MRSNTNMLLLDHHRSFVRRLGFDFAIWVLMEEKRDINNNYSWLRIRLYI